MSFSKRPFAPIPTRRYTALPFESQRRLIPVPEEEGSADERLTSPEEIFAFPVYEMDVDTYDADSDFAQSTFPPEVGEAVNAKPDGNTWTMNEDLHTFDFVEPTTPERGLFSGWDKKNQKGM